MLMRYFTWRCRTDQKCKKLKDIEIIKIIKNTKKILTKSIRRGGSSIKDFSSENGKTGSFQEYFRVYGRKDKNCSNPDCKTTIKKIIISNRATFTVLNVNIRVDPDYADIYTD